MTTATKKVSQADVLAYLKKNAPDIAAVVEKNLTAGDVHVTTALGNEDDKGKKKKPFAALIEAKRSEAKKSADDTAEWTIPLDVVKAEPDQQMIFGWASVAEKGGKLVVDKQDDVIFPADLEKAAYDFVLYSRAHGDLHVKKGTGRLIESMVFTKEKQDILGIDLGLVGWFVGFKVDDPALWEAHKSGKRPEFSIGGRGTRVPLTTS